ncbi:MAG: peptidase C60, sortase A and B [uncultured Rubrobacteraceae bacterium]|uniref:Peptidase C60, sortase A and B n=1 Tax=uncultured Rubrobacteraceae bacterium TaxID=349277 RepID=A0A6J4SHI1_9ACTN|nr:MAG: peptidase C60, sortase A and B [uncultured Rubrobacteraceae bacterium]
MRLSGRVFRDPLLRFGAAALAIAMLFAAAVAAYALLRERPAEAADREVEAAASSEPLVRSDPGIEPLKEPTVALPEIEEPEPRSEAEPQPEPQPEPEPEPRPRMEPQTEPAPEPLPEPKPWPEPEPVPHARPNPDPRPEPEPEPEPRGLPLQEADWPMPTDEQVEATREPRRYDLPSGAMMGLSVPSIGLHDVPVLRSNTQGALDNGVIHARGTSMPWSGTPERNVYLAGHRLGWPGTGSHLVFYRLGELGRGDQISLKGRDGGRYAYRVTDAFVVSPGDTWVMGRIRGRDMLTLQTCTPIPGFQKRLIVRAERV